MPRMALLGAGGSAGFIGAYDAVPNIVAAYGMRRLRAAYTGQLLRLRRASDNAESDFGYVAATGDLDTAAIATFVAATTGLVTTWYDQSGNGANAINTTAANQPLYVASGQNSKPIVRFDGSNDALAATIASGATKSVVVAAKKQTASSSTSRTMWSFNTSSQVFADTDNSAAGWAWYQNQANAVSDLGGTANAWTVMSTIFASVSSLTHYSNGVSTATVDPTSDYSTATTLGFGYNVQVAATHGDVDIAEFILTSAALSAGDRGAAETAMNAYWAVY